MQNSRVNLYHIASQASLEYIHRFGNGERRERERERKRGRGTENVLQAMSLSNYSQRTNTHDSQI